MGTLCAHLLLQFYINSFETSQVFCTWSEVMHVVSIYSSDYFYHFFCKLNLVIFQAFLLSTYVDSMYLVMVTPLMNFTFSDDSLFLEKKNLGGGHKFSEFACFFYL